MYVDEYYNRYKNFTNDGRNDIVPQIKIEKYNTDIIIVYNKSRMRLDNLSYKYYGNPDYGWLIMLANPQYGSMEFEICDGVALRIPYPLITAIERYETAVKEYRTMHN